MTNSSTQNRTGVGWDTRESSPETEVSGHLTMPALKEWAAVCYSILEGEQILTLRKGGIREEGRTFEVRHRRFLLFPTFEHQSAAEQLKPAYRRRVAGASAVRASSPGAPAPNLARASTSDLEGRRSSDSHHHVGIDGFCDVVDVFEVAEEQSLEALESMHIWDKLYVRERLRWKPRQPLWVLALRAYVFANPMRIPYLDSYGGCKSWIDVRLPARTSFDAFPVLSDGAFGAKLEALRNALG